MEQELHYWWKLGQVKDEAAPWWEKQEDGQKGTEPQPRGRDPHPWPLVPPAQGFFPLPQLPLCLCGRGLRTPPKLSQQNTEEQEPQEWAQGAGTQSLPTVPP